MDIRFFETTPGRSPLRRYLDGLDNAARAKFAAIMKDLHAHGMRGEISWIRKIKAGLWEIKIGPHRILFTIVHHDTVVLLHAFRKQSRRLPAAETATAQSRLTRLLHSVRR